MELGALVNVVARAAAPSARDGERLALSLKLVVNVLREHGARPDLVRELQSLAVRSDRVVLVQPPAGAARLEIAGQHFVLSGALREALLAEARAPAARQSSANNTPAAELRTGTAASQIAQRARAAVGATNAQTGSEALLRAAMLLLPLLDSEALAATKRRHRSGDAQYALPLDLSSVLGDEPIDSAQASGRLQSAVQRSPLFLEAQWARAAEQGQTPDAAAAARMPTAERAALQLDALRRDAVAFSFSAWDQQSARLDIAIERNDAERDGQGAAHAPVFTATLQLDLPRIGPVAVRLRLLHDAVAATFETTNTASLQQELPVLAAQLRARGLQPAALSVVADEDGCAA